MQNKTILIADDNTFIRRLISVALQPLGCTLIEAVDGEDALRAIQTQRPDLVLLDLVMPKLSGFEVLEIIRSTPDIANLTVIMLTAAPATSDLAEGRQHGVAAYIVKPFNSADLKDEVSKHLGH